MPLATARSLATKAGLPGLPVSLNNLGIQKYPDVSSTFQYLMDLMA